MKLKEEAILGFLIIGGISLCILLFSAGLTYIQSFPTIPYEKTTQSAAPIITKENNNSLPKSVNSSQVIKSKPKVAIILDDGGYSINGTVKRLLNLKVPLTFSIIPGLEYSAKLAKIAYKLGHEVMVHMPMESFSKNSINSYKFKVTTMMSCEEIEKNIESAFHNIPYAIGMNNHMGSKATADKKVMKIVMEKLKKLNLYYIDSLTIGNSIAYKVAKKVGLAYLKRDVFLDNIQKIPYVKEQLRKLVKIAKNKGYAIGQGHVTNQAMALALEDLVNYLKQEVDVVPASYLIDNKIFLANQK